MLRERDDMMVVMTGGRDARVDRDDEWGVMRDGFPSAFSPLSSFLKTFLSYTFQGVG
jgi:hypothetical protein